MPIHHKRISTGRARGRVGKIRLGEREEDAKGTEHPKALPWFRFDPEDKSMLPTLLGIFGPEPKILKVLLTSNDRELVFPHYLKRYGTSRKTGKPIMLCKGTGDVDGETGEPLPALQRLDLSTGEVLEDFPCDPETCPDFLARKCRYVGSLSFLLRDFPTLRPWQIDTGSEISIRRINTRLRDLAAIEVFGGRGNIAGVPLVLSLGPVQVKRPEWRAPRTVYCMDLELDTALMLDPRWREQTQEIAGQSLALEAPDETQHPEGVFRRSEVLDADIPAERRELAVEAGDVEPEEESGAVLSDDPFRAKLEEVYNALGQDTPDAHEAMTILGLNRRQGLGMIYKHIDQAGHFRRTAMLRELVGLIDKKSAKEDIRADLQEMSLVRLPGETPIETGPPPEAEASPEPASEFGSVVGAPGEPEKVASSENVLEL